MINFHSYLPTAYRDGLSERASVSATAFRRDLPVGARVEYLTTDGWHTRLFRSQLVGLVWFDVGSTLFNFTAFCLSGNQIQECSFAIGHGDDSEGERHGYL